MTIRLLEAQLKQIDIHANPNNEPVTIHWIPPEFRLIGVGTDAIVVQRPDRKDRVLKVFAPERVHKKEIEFEIYQKIGNSPYYCKCFGHGENYIELSYEEGFTLYECLEQGINIPLKVISDVEAAGAHAVSVGLNPRDIHLKNILLQRGGAKLIDVSEYKKPGNDGRWDFLVQGYKEFYHLIKGKKIPAWLMELVKKTYYIQASDEFSVSEFGKKYIQFLGINRYD
jgi:hypothetical protein